MTLQEMLSYGNFIGLIKRRMQGITPVLPPAFYTPTDRVYGNRVNTLIHTGTQGVSSVVPYGSPAKRRIHAVLDQLPMDLLHSFEELKHAMPTIDALIQFDNPSVQKHGQQEIARQLEDHALRFANHRRATVHSALCNGNIWYDAAGDLLPTAATAALTVTYGIGGHAHAALASWAVAGTNISADVIAAKQLVGADSGQLLSYAVYGANVLGYLLGNTALGVQTMSDAAVSAAVHAMSAGDAATLFGLTWLPGYAMTYRNPVGVTQTLCGADQVIFLPAPNRDWWRLFEGSYPVPNQIGAVGLTPEQMVSAFDEVFGAFSFALVKEEGGAPGIYQYFGDTWLPVMDPNAIVILDTTP